MMVKKVFVLEWDEKNLGEGWMNIYNLEVCLYSKEHTLRELLTVTEVTDIVDSDKAFENVG